MKPLLFISSLLLLLAGNSRAQNTYQQILDRLKHPDSKHILVVAHRGDWRNAPENSIDALDRCIKMGVDVMETDVHKTKDGVLVLMHDLTIDRTTTGKGKLQDWTMDSLQTLKLRQGNGIAVPHKIPTLEEAMLFAKGKPILLNLDKAWDCIAEAYTVLKRTGTLQQAIFKGNETLAVMRAKYGLIMDSINYMPMVWPMNYNIYGETAAHPDEYVKGFMQDFKPVGFEVIYDTDTSAVLQKAVPEIKKQGCTVWVNSLWDELCAGHSDEAALKNPDANWGWIIAHGANVIQTDRPQELLVYLRKKHLHL